jgi:hypothetical protein
VTVQNPLCLRYEQLLHDLFTILDIDTVVVDTGYVQPVNKNCCSIFLCSVKFVPCVFSEKEGKAVHLSYEDKLKLVAYTCQVGHGRFNPDTLPPLGVLDVIGRDRRYVHWSYCVVFDCCLRESHFLLMTSHMQKNLMLCCWDC